MLLLSQVIWQRAWGCVEGGLGSPCSLVELGADPSAGPLCLGWLQGVRPRRQLSSTSRKQAGQCVLLLERPRCSLEVGGAHGLHTAAPRVPLPLAAGRELLQRLEIWVGAPTGSQVVSCCSRLFFNNLSVR